MNLMSPSSIYGVGCDFQDNDDFDDNDFKEVEEKIRAELPAELLTDYLRMKERVVISKSRKLKVRQAILEILKWERKEY